MKNVPQISVQEAALKVNPGDVLVVGGFGMTGTPIHLLDAIAETGVDNLTMISNNIGEPGMGGGRMLRNGQIKKAIGSFFTTNPEVVAAYQAGTLEVDLLPQGNLAEAIRAGGAGLGGFLTPTGAGTSFSQDLLPQHQRLLRLRRFSIYREPRILILTVLSYRARSQGRAAASS